MDPALLSHLEHQVHGRRRLACLRARPWDLINAPPNTHAVPSMIAAEEKNLLYYLARDYYSGTGRIVDAGCFLGSSTVALAAGLRDGGHTGRLPVVETFDRFTITDYFMINLYPPESGLTIGSSFREEFDRYTADYKDYVRVHEGDIQLGAWCGEPIEILFLDLAKSWVLNDFVLMHWFPFLIPGKSVLVQQDYVHEFHPWLHVTMEYLAPYFEYLGHVEYSSAVYFLKRPIPPAVLRKSIAQDFSPEAKLELMDQAVRRLEGRPRRIIECAKAALMCELSRHALALEHLRALWPEYKDDPRFVSSARMVAAFAKEGQGPTGGDGRISGRCVFEGKPTNEELGFEPAPPHGAEASQGPATIEHLLGELSQVKAHRNALADKLAASDLAVRRLQLVIDRECTRPLLRTLLLQSGRRIVHLGRKHRRLVAPKNSHRERMFRAFMRLQRRMRDKAA